MDVWQECTAVGCEWHMLFDIGSDLMPVALSFIFVSIIPFLFLIPLLSHREKMAGIKKPDSVDYCTYGWHENGVTFPEQDISGSSNGKTEASKTSYAGSIPAPGAKPQT